MGAASAILAATREPIDALVIEAAYADLTSALRHRLAMHVGEVATPLAAPALWIAARVIGFAPRDLELSRVVAAVPTPLLVIAGTHDRHAPERDARRIFEAAPGPKSIWMVSGAGHQDFCAWDPSAYSSRVTAFLDEYLRSEVAPG
jgi:fermentation-respiration switch protein FrsA (DUF1100 family)